MATKKKKVLHTSPKGVAVWPHLHAPDTKFDKLKGGCFRVKLAVEASDAGAQKLIEQIDAAAEQAIKLGQEESGKKKVKVCPDKPYKLELDEDENETGRVLFNFKMNAKGKTREGVEFTRQPMLYDAALKPIAFGTRIGGGSIIKVSFEVNPFFNSGLGAGVSLRLEAVQVIELKEFSRDGKSFGFGAEEAEDNDDTDSKTPASQNDDEEGGEDNDGDDF